MLKASGPYPLLVLGGSVLFVVTSISSGGFFLDQSLYIFVYGIIASIIRQYVKDEGENVSKRYILSQVILLTIAVALFFVIFRFNSSPASIRSYCMEKSVPMNMPSDWRNFDIDKNIFEVGDYLYNNCIRLYGLSN